MPSFSKSGNIKGVNNFTQSFNLLSQFIRHFCAGRFIFRKNIISKSLAGIKRYRQILRFFFF